MKPKLLLVTTDFPPDLGGIQASLLNTALNLKAFDVQVVAPAHPDAAAFDARLPFRVTRVGDAQPHTRIGRMLRVLQLVKAAAACAYRRRPALILCGHPFVAIAGLIAGRLLRVPYVVWAHGKELLVWRHLLRRSLGSASTVMVHSGHTRGLVEGLGVGRDHVTLIPCAPDCAVDEITARTTARDEPHQPLILTVSRLDDLYKGHDVMMRAMPLIISKHRTTRWVVVGDGSLRPYYERLAAAYGVTDHVTFAGAASRAERDRWFSTCDVFVMVSRDRPVDGGAEGFGVVFLEANAFGKPVVAGRAGGSVDAVVDGVTGVLVDPDNELELAQALIDLLNDPARARQLGRQGATRVREELSWSRTAVAIEDVLLRATALQPLSGN